VNRLTIDVASVTAGNSLGMVMPPLIILTIEIPTAMTRKTTARATERADVNLNESATKEHTCKTSAFILRPIDQNKYKIYEGSKKNNLYVHQAMLSMFKQIINIPVTLTTYEVLILNKTLTLTQ